MEKIDRIFYKKINPSDFKKLYDIDRPISGGGQTYIDAAGIPNDKMADFLSIAERTDSALDPRYTYSLNTYVLGNIHIPAKIIEFAPRNERQNYKISRQTMKDKHPAWSLTNGFPVPNKDPVSGNYTSAGNFAGIIDNLLIIIIRTTYHKFYASFINNSTFPVGWPKGIGLEKMFVNDRHRHGIINFDNYCVEFKNNAANPFGIVVKIPLECHTGYKPSDKRNRIIFGAPGTGKSFLLNEDRKKMSVFDTDYERVTFHADYSYSQFVGTYKPVTSSSGDISYKFVPGPFMRILVKAYRNIYQAYNVSTGIFEINKIKPYLLLIEEINRAHTSAVFGDVFQLLDRNDDNVSEYEIPPSEEIKEYLCSNLGGTPEDFQTIKIPDNMFIWATMNSADQGVFPMDTAFKRRWSFKYIGIDAEEFHVDVDDVTKAKTVRENQGGTFTIASNKIEWNVLRRAINAKLSNSIIKAHEDKLIGPFFLRTMDKAGTLLLTDVEFIDLFCNKVLMYLFEDVAKTKRQDLFSGCKNKDKLNRYSYICEEFRNNGIAIFGDDFFSKEYAEQKNERDKAKADAKR